MFFLINQCEIIDEEFRYVNEFTDLNEVENDESNSSNEQDILRENDNVYTAEKLKCRMHWNLKRTDAVPAIFLKRFTIILGVKTLLPCRTTDQEAWKEKKIFENDFRKVVNNRSKTYEDSADVEKECKNKNLFIFENYLLSWRWMAVEDK